MNSYLIHYGVGHDKGGHSGRYPWGSGKKLTTRQGKLTKAGKDAHEMYKEPTDVDIDNLKRLAKDKKKHGLSTLNDSTDVLKKGSKVGRYSSVKNEYGNYRKYLYITDHDKKEYGKSAKSGSLGFDNKKFWEKTYKATDDITIANGKTVTEYIIDKYGNKNEKEAWADFKNYNYEDRMVSAQTMASLPDSNVPDIEVGVIGRYDLENMYAVSDVVNKCLYDNPKISSEIFNHFSKEGYDAIVDGEDWSIGYDYPIILLNTNKIELIKNKKKGELF